jgi:hypothetical protein
MAATVTATIKSLVSIYYTPDTGLYANVMRTLTRALRATLLAGTAADSIDKFGAKQLSLSGTTMQTLDLTSGLLDPDGAALSGLVRARAVLILPQSTTDGQTVTVAADATNGWTNFVSTGGFKLHAATSSNQSGALFVAPNTTGYAIAGGNKVLDFTPSATQTVNFFLLGASA